MIDLKIVKGTDEPEMVDLFAIEGKAYQVPAKPRPNVALQYLTNVRQHGQALAEMMLLERLLGPEGYQALSEYDDLTPEQLSEVSTLATRLTLGAVESEGNG